MSNRPVSMSPDHNLSEAVDVLLDVGRVGFESGADTYHTVRSVVEFGESLGCDSVHAAPHYSSMSITASMGGEHVTRVDFMRPTGVNLSAVLHLRHFLTHNRGRQFSPQRAREEIANIRQAAHPRGALMISVLLALSCSAFCRLFGGDPFAMGMTFGASFVGALLQRRMSRCDFNIYLITFVVALVASLLAGLACMTGWTRTPDQAIVASVLYLVPGVPLINAIEDIAHGYPVIGTGRLTHALALFICIGLGLVISAQFTGGTTL
jgi:uncharacterized membrane protein YjjP (DUF1212 family)